MSSENGCRIGKIRMKSGGAEVRVLHNALPNDGENWAGTLVKHAKEIATDEGELVGFFVVGLYADGKFRSGHRLDPDRLTVPYSLFPAWVAEIVRRKTSVVSEAENVFDDKFEWVER